MKKVISFIFAGLLFSSVSCDRPNKPAVCSQSVTFEGAHICYGYLLKKEDGSYLRTVQYDDNSNYLATLTKCRIGDKLIVAFTKPDEFFDCTVIDTTGSKPIKVQCLTVVNPERKF